jgi:hypothetical protein
MTRSFKQTSKQQQQAQRSIGGSLESDEIVNRRPG